MVHRLIRLLEQLVVQVELTPDLPREVRLRGDRRREEREAVVLLGHEGVLGAEEAALVEWLAGFVGIEAIVLVVVDDKGRAVRVGLVGWSEARGRPPGQRVRGARSWCGLRVDRIARLRGG